MEKLFVLFLASLVNCYYDHNGNLVKRHIILRNQHKCLMADNFRELIDRHHNYLRQQVAFGKTYLGKTFKSQEMCGLVYDCELEMEARREQENPGSAPKDHGVVRFRRAYKGSILDDVQYALEALIKEDKKLRQMINPIATRYGCWGYMGRYPPKSTLKTEFVCVYNKKATRNGQKPTGTSCFIDYDDESNSDNCTFYENAKCMWGLCYVLDD